jgi:hypothetical protein
MIGGGLTLFSTKTGASSTGPPPGVSPHPLVHLLPFLPSLTSPSLVGVPTNGFDSQTLLPQGLAIKIDQTGRDSSKWCLVGLLWDNVYYTSIAEFRKAWENGTMGKPTRNIGVNETWPGTDKAGPGLSFLRQFLFSLFLLTVSSSSQPFLMTTVLLPCPSLPVDSASLSTKKLNTSHGESELYFFPLLSRSQH